MKKLINALRIAEFNGYVVYDNGLQIYDRSDEPRYPTWRDIKMFSANEIIEKYSSLDWLYNLVQSICREHIDCGIKIDILLPLNDCILNIQEQLIQYYENKET